MLVSAADKLDILRSINADNTRLGEEIWSRFNASKQQQDWYYGEIARIISEKGKAHAPLAIIGVELKLDCQTNTLQSSHLLKE